MEQEGERRRDLRESVLARLADLVQLRPYARHDLSSPHVRADSVHVRLAGPFDLGDVRQLVSARSGKRVEMALDAGPHASFARLHSATSALDGRFAGPCEEPRRATLSLGAPTVMTSAATRIRARERCLIGDTLFVSPYPSAPRAVHCENAAAPTAPTQKCAQAASSQREAPRPSLRRGVTSARAPD